MYQGELLPDFLWPPGYSLSVFLVAGTGISFSLAAQLISALSLSLSLWCMNGILRGLFPKNDSLIWPFLLIFGALSPFLLRQAMVTMSDLLAIFFYTAFLLFAFNYYQRAHFKDLFWAIFFLCWAVITRYVVFVIACPIVLYMIHQWATKTKKIFHLLVLFIPLIFLLLFRLMVEDVFHFTNHDAISRWSALNIINLSHNSKNGINEVTYPNILYQFAPLLHPGFIFLGALFIFVGIRSKALFKKELLLLMISYFAFTLFVTGYHEQNPRHFLPAFILAIILCFPGFIQLCDTTFVLKYKKFLFTAICVIQISLFARAIQPSILLNKLEKEIALYLGTRTNESKLYSFDIDIALKSRNIPQEIQSLYSKKLSAFDEGALLLVNIPKWEKQWQNMNPMINWASVTNSRSLTLEKEFDMGWKLYKINPK